MANATIESRQPPRVVASLKKQAASPRTDMRAARSAGAERHREVTVVAAARPPVPAAPPVREQPASITVVPAPSSGLAGEATAPVTPSPPPPVPSAAPKGLPVGAPAASGSARSADWNAHSLRAKVPTMEFRSAVQSEATQPATHWTISPEGKPQRSEDGGKTWQEVRIDDKVSFRAIEAVGSDVWVGGSEGALYHSIDGGASWTRVNLSSDGGPPTEAIVSITSSPLDPRHLSVKSASGQRWTSDDDGQHWNAVRTSPTP